MGRLAFYGQPTRGSEVISLLETFGGENKHDLSGDCTWLNYYIDDYDVIQSDSHENYQGGKYVCHLYQFNTKWPYRVGDLVMYEATMKKPLPYKVVHMTWSSKHNKVLYNISRRNEDVFGLSVEDLKPYVEGEFVDVVSTKKTDRITFNDKDFENEVELVLGDEYEVVLRDGKIKVVRTK